MAKVTYGKERISLVLKKDSVDWLRQFAGVNGVSMTAGVEILIAWAQFKYDLNTIAAERDRMLTSI